MKYVRITIIFFVIKYVLPFSRDLLYILANNEIDQKYCYYIYTFCSPALIPEHDTVSIGKQWFLVWNQIINLKKNEKNKYVIYLKKRRFF